MGGGQRSVSGGAGVGWQVAGDGLRVRILFLAPRLRGSEVSSPEVQGQKAEVPKLGNAS